MSKRHWTPFATFLFSLSTGCFAATLSIDKSDPACSDATGTPYCTITAGLAHAVNGDTVQVGAGTYYENLTIAKDLTLKGAGAGATVIDGGGIAGVIFTQGQVTIAKVTVQNGDAGDGGLGGGVWVNMGSLTLSDAVIKNNHASDGGGIGTNASLTLIRTVVRDNVASNTSLNSSGGGIYIGGNGTVNIVGSTIANNSAYYSAGGIFNMGYATTLTNSTLSGNTVVAGDGGGALVNGSGSSASVTLSNVTITANSAPNGYGGIYNANGVAYLQNSIVAGNSASAGHPDCGGQAILSRGHNFIGSTSGCNISSASGDLLNKGAAAAKLGPLADNGGATPTHAILSGSAAVDAGDPSGCKDDAAKVLTKDQTGGARAVDGNADGTLVCDIGAFELSRGVAVAAGNTPLTTTEGLGTASFDVVLISAPGSDVTLTVTSSDTTEGTVSPGTLTFTPTNWNVPQHVVITGVDDQLTEGNITYTIVVGTTSSLDAAYDGIDPSDVSVTNKDDEASEESGGGGALDAFLLALLTLGIGSRARAHILTGRPG